MDLATLDLAAQADVGADMVLTNPAKGFEPVLGSDKKPITFKVRGALSTELRDNVRAVGRKIAKGVSLDDHEIGLDMLCALTLGWSDNFEFEGKSFPYSKANTKTLYSRFDWIGKQVLEFANSPANFFTERSSD